MLMQSTLGTHRAKPLDPSDNNGNWVYGYLFPDINERWFLYSPIRQNIEIDTETLCKSMEIVTKDKKQKLFHGDIVRHSAGEDTFFAIVRWSDWKFFLDGINPNDIFEFGDVTLDNIADLTLLGNIFDSDMSMYSTELDHYNELIKNMKSK